MLITTQDILKKKLIKSVKKGIINKHASILPNSRGLLPFFWNVINNKEQGVTYHVISEKIDSGKMLLQKKIKKKNISSYNPKPKKKDFITFKKKGGKIILLRDFINALYFNK